MIKKVDETWQREDDDASAVGLSSIRVKYLRDADYVGEANRNGCPARLQSSAAWHSFKLFRSFI